MNFNLFWLLLCFSQSTDQHHFTCYAVPNPSFKFNVLPDSTFYFNADRDRGPAAFQSDANLRHRSTDPSELNFEFNTSIVSVHGPGQHSVKLHFEPPLLTLMRIRIQIYILNLVVSMSAASERSTASPFTSVWVDLFSHDARTIIVDPDPHGFWSAGPGSESKWETRPEKNKKIKSEEFHVWSAESDVWYSLLRAGCFFCI